ncbi:UDP-N-acetylmuramoyl-L-alanine--D-glutamate ligase [Serinibacter salmoneus]|uniref:UDP-N-acetylmuramoylalanine--D-glutamate ligase n=1 Tax=Serinibacter salmoneus TaxID=556530 RepID=A0A2A9CZF9_9MICO|nr:UDP-N-acetylmuramoyl-L-alanine--D-glutamate ligase [Serinibacter salmoneus]PFG19385.1 UDP-N-acetylmuramoylalanine--D-glutamate ligase [Serinibacter salmoneus]
MRPQTDGGVNERREQWRDAHVLVVGLGLSGLAAARSLVALGARVTGIDTRPHVAEAAAAELGAAARVLAARQDEQSLIAEALARGPRVAIVSPGIPPRSPLVAAPRAAGLAILTEFDLAWLIRADNAPWFFVTGTNGKTTTAQMTSALLQAAGLHAPPLGNMGVAMTTVALEGIADEAGTVRPPQAWPVEIAALQLHDTTYPEPQAGICLNVAEDHLDHFGTMAAYRAAKAKVYQHARGACVYPEWEDGARAMVEEADVTEGAIAVGLSLAAPRIGQIGVVEGLVVDRAYYARRQREALELFGVEDLRHLAIGDTVPPHVLTNAMAAAALVRSVDLEPEAITAGLRGFRLDAHRIATVASHQGVSWVDDSKATNAHAAEASMRQLAAGTCVWVAGGDAKGADLEDLVRRQADRLRAVVLIGKDPSPWSGPLSRHASAIPVIEVPDGDTTEVMRAAVAAAHAHARPGDTVLLAPAGASWDQFRSYAHRGEAFAQAVLARLSDAQGPPEVS